MKFGKLLRTQIEAHRPELKSKFLAYKDLKKQLKAIVADNSHKDGSAPSVEPQVAPQVAEGGLPASQDVGKLSDEEKAFVKALNEELTKFNNFFMENEEDNVIQTKTLSDSIKRVMEDEGGSDNKQYADLCSAIVKHHGEMVLLLNWSYLNYAALVKILKKHDKVTGLLLRSPYLANVMQQPFCSTSLMCLLVKQAEDMYHFVVEKMSQLEGGGVGGDMASGGVASPRLIPVPLPNSMDEDVMRRTEAALAAWSTLQKKPEEEGPASKRQKVAADSDSD